MVPGDIYIGKKTLDEYSIAPVFSGAYDGPDDIVVEHKICGNDAIRFEDFEAKVANVSPYEILEWILKHEEECTKKCPKAVSPAEDISMTSAEMQQIKDAAVSTGKFQVREKPQVSRGNPYANTQEVVEFVERVKTVNPNQNVL